MVVGMSMLTMSLLVVGAASVGGVAAVLRRSHPTKVVLPVLGIMVAALVATYFMASSLGALEFEWDQMNASGGVTLSPAR